MSLFVCELSTPARVSGAETVSAHETTLYVLMWPDLAIAGDHNPLLRSGTRVHMTISPYDVLLRRFTSMTLLRRKRAV